MFSEISTEISSGILSELSRVCSRDFSDMFERTQLENLKNYSKIRLGISSGMSVRNPLDFFLGCLPGFLLLLLSGSLLDSFQNSFTESSQISSGISPGLSSAILTVISPEIHLPTSSFIPPAFFQGSHHWFQGFLREFLRGFSCNYSEILLMISPKI